ncbi:borealin-2 [Sphaeramia orbicularis]|uniref:borealin-2 n=1 Tax=Sphaeramia orbicularis TaxID=375764 RepID=UPI00117E2A32|nr:borealin-2-like [Sphaeramia orbicularis]
MPPRRTKKDAQSDLDLDMRRSKLTLFIQQFEKEAQERMNELEAKLENTLATVDKVFKVELMKMPPSLKNTLMGDLLSVEEISAGEVSIAMKTESLEIQQPLRRMPSKRVKSTDSPPVGSSSTSKSSAKTSKGGRGAKKTRTGSKTTGNFRGTSVSIKRSESLKSGDHDASARPQLRSVVSTGDLPCSMSRSAAYISLTTAQGHTVCFSEETEEELNLDLLDDVAWCHIEKLKKMMDRLSSRCQR